ncbi:MAG: aspartate carbamoyltransferase catalytic subunit [Myxococcales bacterium]
MELKPRHLLGVEPLSRGAIESFLDRAAAFKAGHSHGSLRGQVVVNLFFEASTRTRVSFEIAAKRLGAEAVNWTAAGSSVSKGETLLDTVRNLDAMRPAALVIRHAASGAAELTARRVRCSVVNAGDGAHEHPSQALLDAFTLRERWGALDGKIVAIVGDITHSRVARSNAFCLSKLGATVRLCGPPSLLPPGLERLADRIEVHPRLASAIEGADAVMLLRIQLERQGDMHLPSRQEYARLYGLGPAAEQRLAPAALVLHPGPLNRGLEVAASVADGPRSLILDQVENGVFVRMAILHELLGQGAPE